MARSVETVASGTIMIAYNCEEQRSLSALDKFVQSLLPRFGRIPEGATT